MGLANGLWIFVNFPLSSNPVFMMDSALSSKTRADLVHPDFTSRSQLSLVWSITEYPMRQSRMCFSVSCPKSFLLLKAVGIIRTLLYLCPYPSPKLSSTPVCSWLPETQMDPIPPGSPKSHRGCDSRDREHTLDSGITLTCSPFIFEGFFPLFCDSSFFFYIKPLQTLLWLSVSVSAETHIPIPVVTM